MAITVSGRRLPTWDTLPGISRLSEQHRRFLMRALVLAIGIRIGLLLAGYIVGYIIIDRESVNWTDILTETWSRWDANNYIRIAQNGYQSEGDDRVLIVFFPLFPLAMRAVHYVVPSYWVAGSIVSFVSAVGAGFFLQALVAKDGGDDSEADRSVWYMSLFPTAYFFAMPYTEAMFLVFVTASFFAARNERWDWAGVLGMLACLTRLQGIALIPALGIEALHQNRCQIPWRAYWLALVPVGTLTYLVINWAVLGDPLEFMSIQRDHWFHEFAFPWETIDNTYDSIAGYPPGNTRLGIYEFRAAGMIVGGGLLLAGVRYLRPSYQAFGWVTMLLITSVTFQLSIPRYLLGIFPLFLVLARMGRRPAWHQALLTSSAVLMGILYVVYATNWGF